MSGDEMREQKVRLTIKVEDGERHLKALQVKARLHGETLIALGRQLREKPESIYREGQSALHGQPVEQLWIVEDSLIRAPELKSIVEIANEIRKEALALSELRSNLELLR